MKEVGTNPYRMHFTEGEKFKYLGTYFIVTRFQDKMTGGPAKMFAHYFDRMGQLREACFTEDECHAVHINVDHNIRN